GVKVPLFGCRCCFLFQAEDGIRGFHVTGVQTCALPISRRTPPTRSPAPRSGQTRSSLQQLLRQVGNLKLNLVRLSRLRRIVFQRSEERRVGKECRSLWRASH